MAKSKRSGVVSKKESVSKVSRPIAKKQAIVKKAKKAGSKEQKFFNISEDMKILQNLKSEKAGNGSYVSCLRLASQLKREHRVVTKRSKLLASLSSKDQQRIEKYPSQGNDSYAHFKKEGNKIVLANISQHHFTAPTKSQFNQKPQVVAEPSVSKQSIVQSQLRNPVSAKGLPAKQEREAQPTSENLTKEGKNRKKQTFFTVLEDAKILSMFESTNTKGLIYGIAKKLSVYLRRDRKLIIKRYKLLSKLSKTEKSKIEKAAEKTPNHYAHFKRIDKNSIELHEIIPSYASTTFSGKNYKQLLFDYDQELLKKLKKDKITFPNIEERMLMFSKGLQKTDDGHVEYNSHVLMDLVNNLKLALNEETSHFIKIIDNMKMPATFDDFIKACLKKDK